MILDWNGSCDSNATKEEIKSDDGIDRNIVSVGKRT